MRLSAIRRGCGGSGWLGPRLLRRRRSPRARRGLSVGRNVLGVRVLWVGVRIILVRGQRMEVWLLVVIWHHAELAGLLSTCVLTSGLALGCLLSWKRAREV